MRKLALVAMLASAMLAAFAPSACAQRTASGAMGHFVAPARPAAPAFKAPAFNGVRAGLAFGHQGRPFSRFSHNVPFGSQFFPLLSDWFNPQDLSAQDLYAAGYPVASPLPFVMQGGPAAAADFADRQPQPSQESLLIELRGDRYVRVSESHAESGGQPLTLTPDHDAQPAVTPRQHSARAISHDSGGNQPSVIAAATPAAPLPPVVLVLRDGTRQEVRDYTIADGVLYARGDFYTDGYWNKKIELAKLNVPETLTANSTRGVRFVLPSAPNEVITRP